MTSMATRLLLALRRDDGQTMAPILETHLGMFWTNSKAYLSLKGEMLALLNGGGLWSLNTRSVIEKCLIDELWSLGMLRTKFSLGGEKVWQVTSRGYLAIRCLELRGTAVYSTLTGGELFPEIHLEAFRIGLLVTDPNDALFDPRD